MKLDFSGLISDWGVTCTITRLSASLNSAGHMSGAFVTVGTDLMYVQPINTDKAMRDNPGIMDTHTHNAYQRFAGTALQAEDRIAVPGDVYVYDVVHAEVQDNHRIATLRQTKRS